MHGCFVRRVTRLLQRPDISMDEALIISPSFQTPSPSLPSDFCCLFPFPSLSHSFNLPRKDENRRWGGGEGRQGRRKKDDGGRAWWWWGGHLDKREIDEQWKKQWWRTFSTVLKWWNVRSFIKVWACAHACVCACLPFSQAPLGTFQH